MKTALPSSYYPLLFHVCISLSLVTDRGLWYLQNTEREKPRHLDIKKREVKITPLLDQKDTQKQLYRAKQATPCCSCIFNPLMHNDNSLNIYLRGLWREGQRNNRQIPLRKRKTAYFCFLRLFGFWWWLFTSYPKLPKILARL